LREEPERRARLTKREIEVLNLVAQSLSNQEVANALLIKKNTVDRYLANIYNKLQVNNRVQAFRMATRLGLLPF